jgi:hypothetical protein
MTEGNFIVRSAANIHRLYEDFAVAVHVERGERRNKEMAFVLEIQLDNMKHHLMMSSLEEAKEWLERLTPYVGIPRFSRNDDDPKNIRVTSLEGEVVVALEHIISVRALDNKIYHDTNAEERIADRQEFAEIFRKVDSMIWEKLLERLDRR